MIDLSILGVNLLKLLSIATLIQESKVTGIDGAL